MKYFIFLFIFVTQSLATNLEDYFGSYRSKDAKREISFVFDTIGVRSLNIKGVSVKGDIEHDILGIFGSSMLLKIEVIDHNNEHVIIKTLLVVEDHKFILGIGYYIKMKFTVENKNNIIDKYTLNFIQEKREKRKIEK
jgi:hypothetical protein